MKGAVHGVKYYEIVAWIKSVEYKFEKYILIAFPS